MNATRTKRKINAHKVSADLDALWARHNAEWRDSAQISSFWKDANETDPDLLKYKVSGRFFDLLEQLGIALVVSREYEHLLLSLSQSEGKPNVSYLPLPHPSGIAIDIASQKVFVASTRNPNQLLEFRPVVGLLNRKDVEIPKSVEKQLVVTRALYLPGCVYMHDLALISGKLHGNAVGHNAVVSLDFENGYERVWWPKCIEVKNKPVFEQNHIQLNSIAAGKSLSDSFFSASSDVISVRRPGHQNYAVDGRGVIFSGKSREPIVKGLTRPHSARLNGKRLFVDNSGYGEFSEIKGGKVLTVAKLPGWTRGLCFVGDVAFVGTSRVIPRFSQYAPGLDVSKSICGVHAIDLPTGRILSSITWTSGNQIFAVESMPIAMSSGLPFAVQRNANCENLVSYAFKTSIKRSGAKPLKSAMKANSGKSSNKNTRSSKK